MNRQLKVNSCTCFLQRPCSHKKNNLIVIETENCLVLTWSLVGCRRILGVGVQYSNCSVQYDQYCVPLTQSICKHFFLLNSYGQFCTYSSFVDSSNARSGSGVPVDSRRILWCFTRTFKIVESESYGVDWWTAKTEDFGRLRWKWISAANLQQTVPGSADAVHWDHPTTQPSGRDDMLATLLGFYSK